ncbi:MAG: hypothetical protein methR_P3118 [Methyloprofundus sp.]|nr:MAG: hypothetical protein methR_P3118 [Methyloprofundus sp.]
MTYHCPSAALNRKELSLSCSSSIEDGGTGVKPSIENVWVAKSSFMPTLFNILTPSTLSFGIHSVLVAVEKLVLSALLAQLEIDPPILIIAALINKDCFNLRMIIFLKKIDVLLVLTDD